ncbi:hypothetical protein D3C85_1906000 [compost metagenome]
MSQDDEAAALAYQQELELQEQDHGSLQGNQCRAGGTRQDRHQQGPQEHAGLRVQLPGH